MEQLASEKEQELVSLRQQHAQLVQETLKSESATLHTHTVTHTVTSPPPPPPPTACTVSRRGERAGV